MLMPYCKLKEALGMLKESSRSAVIDGVHDDFDEAKQYLHLEREVEKELRDLVARVADSQGPKLILLCGNVGDGKSHMITRLRETGPELLEEFAIHNDATESSRPDATCIDELRELLAPYKDSNLSDGSQKTLLAINLGTLNNFLVADEEQIFSHLREFVDSKKILEAGQIADNAYREDRPFQFVSFCDHSIFELTAEGPASQLIEEALNRVVAESESNPFFNAFCQDCGDEQLRCPIRDNFRMLQRPEVQRRISELLIECIVKHHQIISIRSLYNFVHDVLVPPVLDACDPSTVCDQVKRMSPEQYLLASFINGIFEHPETSDILRYLHALDPALRRTGSLDEEVVSLMIKEDRGSLLEQRDVPLRYISSFSDRKTEDATAVKTLIRTKYFLDESKEEFGDDTYKKFMNLIYCWHAGHKHEIKEAYRLVREAALGWYGLSKRGEMLVELGNPQLDYRLSGEIRLSPALNPNILQNGTEVVKKFSLVLPFAFSFGKNSHEQILIDYALFEIAHRITRGYRPNHADRSNFVTFCSFVDKIAADGELDRRLHVKETESGRRYVLERDEFDEFCFRESER